MEKAFDIIWLVMPIMEFGIFGEFYELMDSFFQTGNHSLC
jgi:hypothetical protein